MLKNFSFCATWRAGWRKNWNFWDVENHEKAYGAPGGTKLRNQTWNSEFPNDAINDVDSDRDAKHHYLKFLLIRFSCKALVEIFFYYFMISNTSTIWVFAPVTRENRFKTGEIRKNMNFVNMGKNYFLWKIIFS